MLDFEVLCCAVLVHSRVGRVQGWSRFIRGIWEFFGLLLQCLFHAIDIVPSNLLQRTFIMVPRRQKFLRNRNIVRTVAKESVAFLAGSASGTREHAEMPIIGTTIKSYAIPSGQILILFLSRTIIAPLSIDSL